VHNHDYDSVVALPSRSGEGPLKDLCYLHESPVKTPGMPQHVAFQKTNATTIDPVRHPNAGNRGLLVPLNLNLHSSQPQQSILLHHQPTRIVLLAGAPTVPLLDPHNLDDDSRRMSCLLVHRAA
jgi:hypothetical protein